MSAVALKFAAHRVPVEHLREQYANGTISLQEFERRIEFYIDLDLRAERDYRNIRRAPA